MFNMFRFLIVSLELVIHSWIYTHFRLVDLPWNSPWTWFAAFFTVDFLYYWFHRAAHGMIIQGCQISRGAELAHNECGLQGM
jgi:sterol desaturase/sphingolipid hydroxylase (fatty acid hydroxylase superfamily)